jgi:hypothetical protein
MGVGSQAKAATSAALDVLKASPGAAWGLVKAVIASPITAAKTGAALGMGLVATPFIAILAVGKGIAGGVGSVFRNHRALAVGGTLLAAATGVGLWAKNRAERDTMESYQQAAMQMQAMRSSYMDSVTPQEYAAMQARMRQGGDGGSSMAQAEQQRRAAAQQAAAPAAS